jgi:hypothetical protein
VGGRHVFEKRTFCFPGPTHGGNAEENEEKERSRTFPPFVCSDFEERAFTLCLNHHDSRSGESFSSQRRANILNMEQGSIGWHDRSFVFVLSSWDFTL